MPSSAPKTPPKLVAILAAVAIVAPVTAKNEGFLASPKPDPVGIVTGCFGERVDQSDLDTGKIYSRDECMVRLRKRLASEYAPPILTCLPQLNDRRRVNVFAALIDASWNAGPKNVCKSPMAAKVRLGMWRAACDSFRGWHVKPKGKLLRGLVKRRETERQLCLRSA